MHIFAQAPHSAGGGGLPCVLQVYVPPAHGLRYVVSYAYEGNSMAARMEVTARPFAARYPPNPPPCAAAAMAAATAIQSMGVHGASLADDCGGRGGLRDWVVPPPAMPPFSGTSEAMAAAAEAGATVVPTVESAADSRRVREEMRKAVSAVVQFMERAHGVRAQAGTFEFVVGFDGVLRLIGMSRITWIKHLNPRAAPVGAGVNVARHPRSVSRGAASSMNLDTQFDTAGDFGVEDAGFFKTGATIATAINGRTVRTPYSPFYGTGRGFGMRRGVTPTTVPGLGETLGKSLDAVLHPLPAVPASQQGQSTEKIEGGEREEGEEGEESFDAIWGFDKLPPPVELPPKIRYAAPPALGGDDSRPQTATAQAMDAVVPSSPGPPPEEAQCARGGGQYPTWQDEDEDDENVPSGRPATSTSGYTLSERAKEMAYGVIGTEKRRPVVAIGPPSERPRLSAARRGGGATLAAARAADFAAPVLDEVEALREGLAAANFDRDNLANGLHLETQKHFAEAGGLWLQNADLSKSLEEALLRVSQLEAESREYCRRHAAEEKARGDIEARLKDAELLLETERATNARVAQEAVARADDLAAQLETANAELAMLTTRDEIQTASALAEEKFIGALRKENEELRKRLQDLMNQKGYEPMPVNIISDAMKLREAKIEKEEIAAGKPPPPRVPESKLQINIRDITRVESLRYGIEEAGVLEGLDRLMVKVYGEMRDVWRYYVSVGRTKRGADGEARMSMLQFARFTIDIGVVKKLEEGEFGTEMEAGTSGIETDKTAARKALAAAKGADMSLMSGEKVFAPNADSSLIAALAETNKRDAAIAETRAALNDTAAQSLSSTSGLGHSMRRSRGIGGTIALADADRIYAVVTLRQVEAEMKTVSAGGQLKVAGRLPDDRMLDFEEFCQAVCRLAHLLRSGATTGHASRKELGFESKPLTPVPPATSGGDGRPRIMLSGTLTVGPSGPFERSTAVAGQGPFPVGPAVVQPGFLTFLEQFLTEVVFQKARRRDDLKALAAEEAARKRRVPIWQRGFQGGKNGRDRL